jgi:hypothetical protein
VEWRTVFTPAAKQTAVVGHDAERRRLVPAGGGSSVQERPPEAVLIMVEPAPVLPLLPTATHSSRLEHEMPVTSTALKGGDWAVQLAPLLDVSSTYGAESRFVPVAMHCAPFGQSTDSKLAPVGIELVGTHVVKSVVLNDVALPNDWMPTATQVVAVEQETEVRATTLGVLRIVQG